MSDVEGIEVSMRMTIELVKMFLTILLGKDWNGKGGITNLAISIVKGTGGIVFGKPYKYFVSQKKRNAFLSGGESSLAEIFKEKGSLPNQVITLDFQKWSEKERTAFLKTCEDYGVKVVPFDGNEFTGAHFVFHETDANLIQQALVKSGLLARVTERENMDDFWDDLPDREEREQEVKEAMDEAAKEEYSKEEYDRRKENGEKATKETAEKEVRHEKKEGSVTVEVPKTSIKPVKGKEGADRYRVSFGDGIAIIPSSAITQGKNGAQITLEAEREYPVAVKGKDGKTETVTLSGRDLEKRVEKLKKQQDKQKKTEHARSEADKMKKQGKTQSARSASAKQKTQSNTAKTASSTTKTR